jgi:hypothetical protein
MSRARLRRLERALNASAASQVIEVYGHLPDLPLPDNDTANPAHQPGPVTRASPLERPAAQEFGASYGHRQQKDVA